MPDKIWVEDTTSPIIAIYGDDNHSPRWIRSIIFIDKKDVQDYHTILSFKVAEKLLKQLDLVRKKHKKC